MIKVAISYAFGEDSKYHLEEIPPDIQLAIFKYEAFKKDERQIVEALERAETNVLVVHLPLDILKQDVGDVLELIFMLNQKFRCENFIIHPNKMFISFLHYYLENRYRQYIKGVHDYKLCIETFQWRKKKEVRSPLDILEYCIEDPEVKICIDTSHIEDIWFDHKIMRTLLRFTNVIHLSNRAKGHGSHLPFNSPKGELNLVGFVRNLKYRYKWKGTIVLEYMPEYQHKLLKSYYYIQRLLE